jgi:hypothetical protein
LTVELIVNADSRLIRGLDQGALQFCFSNLYDRDALNRHPQATLVVVDDSRYGARGEIAPGIEGREPAVGEPRHPLGSAEPDNAVGILVPRPIDSPAATFPRPEELRLSHAIHETKPAVCESDPETAASVDTSGADLDSFELRRKDERLESAVLHQSHPVLGILNP